MPTPSGLVTKQELIDAQLDTAHLGRVVNSKDASGAPISTSTNRTGGVNKTLDALEGEYQSEIDSLGDRSSQAIAQAEQDFSDQRDDFNSTFQSQFAYVRVGNVSDHVGQSLPESDKLNSYQHPDDSGEWFGPIQSQSFPIIIPADPSSSSEWALVNALTEDKANEIYQSVNLPLTSEVKNNKIYGNIIETSGHSTVGVGSAIFKRDDDKSSPAKAGANPEVIDQDYVIYDAEGAAFTLYTIYGTAKRNLVTSQVGVIADAGKFNSTDGKWYTDDTYTVEATDNTSALGIVKQISDLEDCHVDFGSGRIMVSSQTIFAGSRNTYEGAGKEVCKFVSQGAQEWVSGDSIVEFGDGTSTNNVTVTGVFFDAVTTTGVSGCSMNMFYNMDFNFCQFKSGDYDDVNLIECAGLRVKQSKHTRLNSCSLNNSLCYQLWFSKPGGGNVSLSEFDLISCAFDESQAGIVSYGFIESLSLVSCNMGGLGLQGESGASPAANHQLYSTAPIADLTMQGGVVSGGGVTPYGFRFSGGDSSQDITMIGVLFRQFTRYPVIDLSTQGASLTLRSVNFENNGTGGGSSDINDWTSDYLTCNYTTDVYILRADQGKKSFIGCSSDITNRFNIVADPTDSTLGSALWEYDATQNLIGGARIGTLEANGRVGLSKGDMYKLNNFIASGFSGLSTTTVNANSHIKIDIPVSGVELTHRVEWSYASDWSDSLIVSVRPTASGVISVIVVNPTSTNISFPGGNLFYDVYDRSNQ